MVWRLKGTSQQRIRSALRGSRLRQWASARSDVPPVWRRLLCAFRPRARDQAEVVELLFALARRHTEAFSVVVVEWEGLAPQLSAGDRGFGDAALLGPTRRSDRILVDRHGRYVIHCPRTDQQGALRLSERIHKHSSLVPDCSARVGQASFPEDAVTLEELVRLAVRALQGEQSTDGGEGRGPGPPATEPRWVTLGPEKTRERKTLKRGFDLALVVGAAPLWLLVIGLIAAAQLCADRHAPIFYRQIRTGRGGRRFPMLKFRTMMPGADQQKSDFAHLNQLRSPDFKIPDDPRVTRLGRILRRTSLDELPQLFNVLRGEMSLVGPRPTSFGPETYQLWQTARLDVTPGMTGRWQVERSTPMEFDDRLRHDIAYIRTPGLWKDAVLLLRTFRVVLSRGAE